MHDDESLERFLLENKPLPPAPPADELQHLSAQLGEAPPQRKRSFHRRPATGAAAVFFGIALALLVLVTRKPHVPPMSVPAANIEAVLTDSYDTLEDTGDEESVDGSDLAWFEPGVSR